mgnify:CR=1 FL=1
MKCCNAYESDDMKNITGETLRPGGFTLTDKAVKFCKLSSKDSIMDLFCLIFPPLSSDILTYN